MSNAKIVGSRNALLSSLMFYRRALIEDNCPDINKEIAEFIGKNLALTDEQIDFLQNANKDYDMIKIFDDMQILLHAMIESNRINKHNLNTIIINLDFLKNNISNYIKKKGEEKNGNK